MLSGGGDHQVLVWDVSLSALAGKSAPLSAAERQKAWDQLGTIAAKEAIKTMGAMATDPKGTVAFLSDRLKPVPAEAADKLDAIFRDLDDKRFAVREKASRDLSTLGPGAIAGVRQRAAKAMSEEVRRRADLFLKRLEREDMTPERIRFLRALDILTAMNTPAARALIEKLAGGVDEVWETEVARQVRRSIGADARQNKRGE